MRTNVVKKAEKEYTHTGVLVKTPNAEEKLRRLVMTCLLWEDNFYVDGKTSVELIKEYSKKVSVEFLCSLAVETRTKYHLRHVPLLLLVFIVQRCAELPVNRRKDVAETIATVISRVDEMAELMALYIQQGNKKYSNQLKDGLALAFSKFDEYQFGKYKGKRNVKSLVDVINIARPRPQNEERQRIYKSIVDGTLKTPDTWEVALSSGEDKKETFERLLSEGKLGFLALIRNLRNMIQADVDPSLVRASLLAGKGQDKVLPFRYIAASRQAPKYEKELDVALIRSIEGKNVFEGKTVVLVDVSGSMEYTLSGKSDMTRMDAACALASLIDGDVAVYSFSNYLRKVPHRLGMAGVDVIQKSQPHGSTELNSAVRGVNDLEKDYDRIIIITDEQSTDGDIPDPIKGSKAYIINVANYSNGVGYGRWTHISGFSENIFNYIREFEKSDLQ